MLELISVYGLNLSVPEDAKAIIKPWDQREDTSQFIDSGVDDQVRVLVVEAGSILIPDTAPDHMYGLGYRTHPLLAERSDSFDDIETRWVRI